MTAKPFLTAALILAATGAQAQGPQPIISSAEIAASLLRAATVYGRLFADIRYGAMEADGANGRLTIRDLRLSHVGGNPNCEVTVGRIGLSGITFWGAEEAQMRADASDISIANNCFGTNAVIVGAFTGQDRINVSLLSLDTRQVSGSGAYAVGIEALAPGLARIEAAGDFDYVALFAPGLLNQMAASPYAEPPAAEPQVGLRGVLRSAHVSVEDQGLWSRISALMPPETVSPDAIADLVTAPPGSALHGVQQDMADALSAFVAAPGRITAEIRPAQPITFDTTGWQEPDQAIEAFAPVFSNALPTPAVTLMAAPDAGDARATGLALARGQGLPQNSRLAVEMLTPLADDPEVALALAELTLPADPGAAYAHAQRAAAAGAVPALAVLDRIESRLTVQALLAAQPAADAAVPDAAYASALSLRDAALAQEEGAGTPRSHALAWRLASLAAAAGDVPARSLMARLDARFGTDPAWLAARDQAAQAALADWQGRNLSTGLAAGGR